MTSLLALLLLPMIVLFAIGYATSRWRDHRRYYLTIWPVMTASASACVMYFEPGVSPMIHVILFALFFTSIATGSAVHWVFYMPSKVPEKPDPLI